jgi:bifunctional DNA-binding transcriptional regulator/antitoxin component of YhaV-PrlF toxin-antitoxin module
VAVGRAQLRKNSQITLPVEVRRALHIEEGDVDAMFDDLKA